MNSKNPSAIDDKNKNGMLVALYKKGSMKKTDLYSEIPKSNLNSRKLDELRDGGCVILTPLPFENNTTMVELTDLGRAMAILIIEIKKLESGEIEPKVILEKAGEQNQMDCGSPSEEGNTVKE